ncbi:hypothetical protein VSP10_00270 [Myroides odoratimimus]|uniref:hypothetical protein n=1 Tax=Myroides odoratimimus TaxID=76832 RepID=UPI000354493A|nr:hypothetical protein [Myroides odoratimimus]EPH08389.1 hypothetical protein HMPREF9713_03345 [Myroides odoratimimus CCUG 12700]MEC4051220.1 hypothetical protein [Myroides odoratimimus]
MKRYVLFICLIFLVSCVSKGDKDLQTKLSFYYWRTNFQLDSLESTTLKELEVDKLYIRYFDIGLQGDSPIPIRPILFKDSIPDVEIVPVVYIKNEVLVNSKVDRELSKKIVDYINQINKHNHIQISEIQLDCDWSLKSKDSFFELIESIKKASQWKVSSTIRLHQVKYAGKTGIPKVDYGVLMYYNMGTISADSLNSIYDRNIGSKYIGALADYPLELKYAFPIYSWVVHTRANKVVRLISRVRTAEVDKISAFKKIDETRYSVTKEGMYFGQLFLVGDQIKVETTTSAQLLEMKKDLEKASGKCPSEIILYDLNSRNIPYYEKEVWKKIVVCE